MNLFRLQHKKRGLGKLIYLSPDEIFAGDGVRLWFDEDKLDDLARSIRANGLLQPIGVAKNGSGYKLVFGERRLKACIIARQTRIPCMLTDETAPDAKLLSMIENLQREELTFFEQAEGIQALILQCGMPREEISRQLGLSESAISNKLRLLGISSAQREKIEAASLSERHARALLRICGENARAAALNEIIKRRMSVSETDKYIDRLLLPKTPKGHSKMVVKDIRLFVNSINKAINVMKISGIDARSQREEDEDYIKYTVLISKKPNDLTGSEAI